MKINDRDRRLALSANASEIESVNPKVKKVSRLGDAYTQIARFPGRVVSIETAYGRIRRNPDMSIKDACLTPKMYSRSTKLPQMYGRKKLVEQAPKEYLDDLRSQKSNAGIGKTWELDPTTVRHHRKLLSKDENE